MAQYDVDLRDYWRVLKKRKAIIILVVVLVGLCSYGFAKLREPVPLYRAESAVKINQEPNLVDLLSGGMLGATESMDTHAYIITSYPVMALTLQALGWVPSDLPVEEIRLSTTAMASLERLKSMVATVRQRGTNIIDIVATSRDPKQAARIANTVADAYREFNIREKNQKTIDTKKFIEEQLQMTSQGLQQAEKELQAFKEGYGLISIDEQTRNNLARLHAVEVEYEKINGQRKEVVSKLKLINSADPDSIEDFEKALFTAPQDSPVHELRKTLGDLFLERQTLLIHLTAKHPQVIEVDDKIRAVAAEIRDELNSQLRTLKIQEVALLRKLKQQRRENRSIPEKALMLVRLEREVQLQEVLYSQLKTKYQETLIQGSGQVEEVAIMRPAVEPAQPFNIPSKAMIVATGIVMGLILGIVLAFGAEVFDTSMGTIEDVEESLKVPVLGVIPFLGKEEKERLTGKIPGTERTRDLIMHYDPKSLAAEAFRSLRTNIQFTSVEKKSKTLLITSSFVQEGKTLNSINLALSVAQAGDKVLLVECDLRKPVIYQNFGLNRDPGLTDYVLGNYTWQEVVSNITDVMLGDFEIDDILRTPGLDNLHIMTSGTQPPNPSEILSSERFRTFVKESAEHYDFVFIDAPPILPVADATEIAPIVDGVVIVYTVGKIARGVLKRAKSSLDNIDAKVMGVILNNVKPEIGPDYFRYHTQHYYGSDERPIAPAKAAPTPGFFRKLKFTFLKGSRAGWIALAAALVLILLGVFWKHLIP